MDQSEWAHTVADCPAPGMLANTRSMRGVQGRRRKVSRTDPESTIVEPCVRSKQENHCSIFEECRLYLIELRWKSAGHRTNHRSSNEWKGLRPRCPARRS